MAEEQFISVIIPNRNSRGTIGTCLEAVFSSRYANFEVIVVDDASADASIDIIRQYPCRLVRLERHAGASAARNTGALNAKGEVLFFIDADCVVRDDALDRVNAAFDDSDAAVIGGTYTLLPYDKGFFSTFQSVFIHYSETKRSEPDYVATHALAVRADVFRSSGGFAEDFLPILEDVEFSHRLVRQGYRLRMKPEIQVQHIFNFTLSRSLRNAFRKSRYWTAYSLGARDLFADSGTASHELKVNGAAWFISGALLLSGLVSGRIPFLLPIPLLVLWNIFVNRNLFSLFFRARGFSFAALAALYYMALYPSAVLAGACRGLMSHVGGTVRANGARL